jgi:hypothetical protein
MHAVMLRAQGKTKMHPIERQNMHDFKNALDDVHEEIQVCRVCV